MQAAVAQTGLKHLCCIPQEVKSYETGHCYVLENSLKHRTWAPLVCGLPAL